MANLTEVAQWVAGIYQLEVNDPVEGGADGIDNRQAKQLGDRTAYLKAQLEALAANVGVIDIEAQNALWAALKYALDQAGLANYGVKALRQQAQQEGELVIQNRGLVNGATLTKSVTATRNLSIAAGLAFAGGRRWPVAAVDNAASVPSNTTGASVTVYAYLLRDANQAYQLAVTAIGEAVPAAGIKIYNITIPAGNTDGTDPNLASVTLTDVRRLEPQFPVLLDNPASASAVLNTLYANDYRLTFDVISATGAPCESKCLQVSSRATNGFTVLLASAADDVTVRWRASKLNN